MPEIAPSPARSQRRALYALGKSDHVMTESSTQAGAGNNQNEITSISGLTTATYEANGNMTGDNRNRYDHGLLLLRHE